MRRTKELAPTPVHIVPKLYIAPEADIATSATHKSGNSHAEDEIASVRQISWSATGYGWSALLFQMPTHFRIASEGFKHSAVAVPTRGRRKSSPSILIATIFTASALCIWVHGFEAATRLTASSRNDLHSCKREH